MEYEISGGTIRAGRERSARDLSLYCSRTADAGQCRRTAASAGGQHLRTDEEDAPYYDAEPWRTRGLRRMSVDRYAVFYRTDRAECIVTVVRVMYVGGDVEAQLATDDED